LITRIAAVQVEPNENVQPGQTVVMLTSGGRLEVEVSVPEVLIAQVREGDPVTVAFDDVHVRDEIDVRVDAAQALHGGFDLGPADIIRREEDLALEVREVDGVEVDQADRAHAGGRPRAALNPCRD